MTDGKSRRGFASMTPEKRREIAAMGGRATPNEKRGFAKDRELASRAGSKGGKAVRASTRAFNDREFARECGRKGGRAAAAKARAK